MTKEAPGPSAADPTSPQGTLVLRTFAMPADTNPNGDIFGGWIMSQMDMGGGMLAKEIAHGRVTTVTADKMTFMRPVKVGDAVCVYGEVLRIGTTSTDIRLEVWTKDLIDEFDQDRVLVTTGVFRYVAIDAHGRPYPIPDDPRFAYARASR
jgi:acyl-CoA thioesterase YciA